MSKISLNQSLLYKNGTQFVHDENDTLLNITPHLKKIGITRIANITHLDRIGIPVFSTIRPIAMKGAISIYSGKGITESHARISAIMEGFERAYAEPNGLQTKDKFIDSYEKIQESHNTINPIHLTLPGKLINNTNIEWTEGWDLLNKESVFVPSNAVYHPYDSEQSSKLFRSNTNGLAAGNTIEEAILHGLLEVVERDALSIAEFNRNSGKEIILDNENSINFTLFNKFKNADIELRLWLLSHDTDITTVVASTDDLKLKDPALLVMGAGSHLNPEIAIRRAITEVAQSRLVQIHGTREDTDREKFVRTVGHERMKRLNKIWYKQGETIQSSKLKDISCNMPFKNIETVLNQIKHISKNVVVINLSKENIGTFVVRLIIPGFEVYTVDRERIGMRMRVGNKWKNGV
ncbi:MAG: YcaO-related McrA-glycine thioamidation protein [Methanosarcinales archaeon]|jgi:ribosomal protein S12 methylthiotransferase accessory factor|nr:YcaO-related McrA-glycine thioamidation protein [Methanosarcinales archaeon]